VRPRITAPADAVALVPDMPLLEQDHLRVILLNTKNEVLRQFTLYIGTAVGLTVRMAEVFREAVRDNAIALVLVHNHPSGDPEPSPEDVSLSWEVVRAGRLLDVRVLDYIVVGDPARDPPYISLRQRGVMDEPASDPQRALFG
jgi:DNA repair protein RadC